MKHFETYCATRRGMVGMLLGGGLAGISALAAGKRAMAETAPGAKATSPPPPAHRGQNQVKPLPFNPAKLDGLSEKLIVSHHDNNYAGAVKRLNQIQQQIGALPPDAAPFQMGALKREELIATNSMILHELYFANLGGGGPPNGSVATMIQAEYGTLAAWQAEFLLTGLSLGGGSGWVMLSFDPYRGGVRNCWAADHTHSLAGGVPLLVMDMYEHSYHMDYGANAKGYIDAFFRNIDWQEVNRRADGARRPRSST